VQPLRITPTIQAEDITPEILTYTHDSSNSDQTTHYVTFDKDVVVDILIVGGRGAPYGKSSSRPATSSQPGSSRIVIIKYKASTTELNYNAQWKNKSNDTSVYFL